MDAFNGRLGGSRITTPTLEESSVHAMLLDSGNIAAARTVGVFVAPHALRMDQVSMAFGAAVAGSATDYWTVTLSRRRAGTSQVFLTKTTRPVTSGGDGEPITALAPWNFAGLAFGTYAVFGAGDLLVVSLTPTGAPPALAAPAFTFRAMPSSEAVPA